MKQLLFLILFLFVARTAYSDEFDPTGGNYISISNAYRFELPAFNLSIRLPGKMGFRVPYWIRDDISLNINDDYVSYCYDVSEMKSVPYTFQFSLSGRSREDLLFRMEYVGSRTSEEIEEEKKRDYFISELPSVSSQAGVFDGMLLKYDKLRRGRTYRLISGNLLLTFIIFCEEKNEIRQCEKIIRSLQFTDLKKIYDEYLVRQANRKTTVDDETSSPSFAYTTDTLKSPAVFSFPSFGLQMAYPSGWTYGAMVQENIIRQKRDTIQINWSQNDLIYQKTLMLNMKGKQLYMYTRLFPKTNEGMNLANQTLNAQKIIKKFKLEVDGLEVEAKTSGAQDLQTLSFMIPLKTYIATFSIMAITSGDLIRLQPLLSSIRFSEEEKAGLPKARANLPSVIQEMKISELNATGIPELNISSLSQDVTYLSVPVVFPGAGISFDMPRGEQIYTLHDGGNPDGKEKIIIEGEPSVKGNPAISVLMEDWQEPISVMLSNNDMPDVSFDTYFGLMVKNYETLYGVKIKKHGFVTVNGQKWALQYYENQGMSMYTFLTRHKDYLLTLTYSGENKQYKAALESMLFSFRFIR